MGICLILVLSHPMIKPKRVHGRNHEPLGWTLAV